MRNDEEWDNQRGEGHKIYLEVLRPKQKMGDNGKGREVETTTERIKLEQKDQN
jgi:hypothetical protein